MANEEKPRKRRTFLQRLRSKYRFLVIDDGTFEERVSIRLNRINVLLIGLGLFIITAAFVAMVIVLTPLKRYIPGYTDPELVRFAQRSAQLADSLQRVVPVQQLYIENMRRVLSGEVTPDSALQYRSLARVPGPEALVPGGRDSSLRRSVQRDEAYSLSADSRTSAGFRGLSGIFFFPPLRGTVSSNFDRALGHFGVDIVTAPDEAVKACLDGTVTLASWTTDGGHVIQIQHANDLVSVYKHNSVLLKKVGDRVKGGEVVSIVGNSGELTTGPHLHFELWHNGEPVDPAAYMALQ
ncbi:MAG: M23 family metallopeptidase [Flavobacteriales bacterium]|nr:M23 family metallopeptidase [Flavobacteriales bacterium]